jgi:hypothetical protein
MSSDEYTKTVPRDGWYSVITAIPAALSTVAYRYESGGWFIPDPSFNEASLVGARITPLYSQGEVDELVAAVERAAAVKALREAAFTGYFGTSAQNNLMRLAELREADRIESGESA